MFNKIRAGWRVFLFSLTTIGIVTKLIVYQALGILKDSNRMQLRSKWARRAMRILGFRVKVVGSAPKDETILYVGNHRSTLDPLLAFIAIDAWPVAKMWVKNFPLIGYGSELSGIIFVDKDRRQSRLSAKSRILQEMEKGNSIMLFPEGHTHSQPYTKTFHKGSFEQAAAGGFRVVPFVLEYKDVRDYWEREQSIVGHFMDRFGKKRHDIHLEIGPPLSSDNPWTLMRQSRSWIDETLVRVHTEWGNTHYEGQTPQSRQDTAPAAKADK